MVQLKLPHKDQGMCFIILWVFFGTLFVFFASRCKYFPPILKAGEASQAETAGSLLSQTRLHP